MLWFSNEFSHASSQGLEFFGLYDLVGGVQVECKSGRVREEGVFGQSVKGVQLLMFLIFQSAELVKNSGTKMLNWGWVRLHCSCDDVVHVEGAGGVSCSFFPFHFLS